jgi:hypothetical protein
MHKAYIVLAHHQPEQLGRLIQSLDDGRSEFFIHLDRASDPEPFRKALASHRTWSFVKNEHGGWGQLGIVKGTLHGLRAVVDCGRQFGMISLISGQDYPLRSNAYFDHFFALNRGKIFMEFFPLPAEVWPHGGMDRIHDYHFGDRRRRSRMKVSRWMTGACNASILFKRRFPRDLKPFGGWQWWSMPMEAVNEILFFVARRPDFLRYHRWSLLPDEMFFQTILLNSHSEWIGKNLVNNCLRFVDWDNANPATPATLTEKYLVPLLESKSLFARKFDLVRDSAILDRIDAKRSEEEQLLRSGAAGQIEAVDFARGPDTPRSAAWPGTKIDLFNCRNGEFSARNRLKVTPDLGG